MPMAQRACARKRAKDQRERGSSGETPAFARDLSTWMERTAASFADRIIGVDAATARLWGRMSGDIGHFNVDLLIAATALVRGLTVVIRNKRHFEQAGARVLDPFENDEA